MSARDERLIERAKTAMGWGWERKPCRVCPSTLTHETSRGDFLCFWHWDEPIQLELIA